MLFSKGQKVILFRDFTDQLNMVHPQILHMERK